MKSFKVSWLFENMRKEGRNEILHPGPAIMGKHEGTRGQSSMNIHDYDHPISIFKMTSEAIMVLFTLKAS
jgi:hypothetical protein